jgi:hypothetical protein
MNIEPDFDTNNRPSKADVMFVMNQPEIPESERWQVPADPWGTPKVSKHEMPF